MNLNVRTMVGAGYAQQAQNKLRHKKTLQYLEFYRKAIEGKACLDAGEPNDLGRMIEEKFRPAGIINTNWDLDLPHSYNSVGHIFTTSKKQVAFCFEVIEHLCNPLVFLDWCYNWLPPYGLLILSTPMRKPNWLRNKREHFHEFNRDEFDFLIQKAGFCVTKEWHANTVPWWWCFRGIRPFLRFVYWNRTGFFTLAKLPKE